MKDNIKRLKDLTIIQDDTQQEMNELQRLVAKDLYFSVKDLCSCFKSARVVIEGTSFVLYDIHFRFEFLKSSYLLSTTSDNLGGRWEDDKDKLFDYFFKQLETKLPEAHKEFKNYLRKLKYKNIIE